MLHAHRYLIAFVSLVALYVPSAVGHAQNPVDVENHKLAERVIAAGASARGVIPLLELWDNWDNSTPQKLQAELARLAVHPAVPPARKVLVETMLAQARLRRGDIGAVAGRFQELGYVHDFRVIGPFDNEGKRGFDQLTPVEEKRMEAPDMQMSYQGRERQVSWRDLPEVMRSGFVPFGAVMRPFENVCALAETFVNSKSARPLSLWVGAGGAVKVYWNGELVINDPAYRGPSPDRSVALVAARAGNNRLLVKTCVTTGAWGFQLRIGDAEGGVAKGLTYARNATDALDIQPNKSLRLPAAPEAPLAYYEARTSSDKASAELIAEHARLLMLTNSDDPAERRAKQLAERAADLQPTAENLRLAATLAEERAEIMRFRDRALALAPNNPEVLLLHAEVTMRGPAPEKVLPILDRISEQSPELIPATLLRVRILRELELRATALARLRQLIERIGPTAALLREVVELEEDQNHSNQAHEARVQLLGLRFDDSTARRALINDALARKDKAAVMEQLDVVRALTPGSLRTLLYIATVLDALGRDDLVLATYRHALQIAPEADSVYVALARSLLRAKQSDAAYEALKKALALKPQDAAARELLEEVRPVERVDEGYAVSQSELLKRRRTSQEYPYSVLQDLTVKTVFDNGLGSEFRQLAVQIHDQEGARRFRTHSFQYDPDTQHVDVRLMRVYRKDGRELESVRTYEMQLGEPWYRLYYDTRAVQIVFPNLEPGDVVEVRYRVDDVAHRNLFADYFGDMHLWQDLVPVASKRYVLITPTSREIFTNDLGGTKVEHKRTVSGEQRIDDYVWNDVPPLRAEDRMPGMTEVSPYLHVSTYRSWKDVGHWYWGLIHDQLYADQALKKTVAELVADKKSVREKVVAIHDWVVTHTRYVGLEFGIHGFLPYRVPLIVQRGFGDCKDKASLMYTMMREAGIDARIVLLRTRRNGAIRTEPASLAVFDHAITYVPELDMYLDGTAEHSGTSELPSEDQGVTVLLVGPNDAELRVTPILPASNSVRRRQLTVALESDGSARVEGREEVAGSEAAGYRQYYEAEGTRAERFERALASIYPGVELLSQKFEGLHVLENPVRYAYRLKVPRFGMTDGDSMQVAPSVLSDLVRSMARAPKREQPLDLGTPNTYIEERTFNAPKGHSFQHVPKDGEVASDFGSLKLQYVLEGNTLKVRTEFVLRESRIEPKAYSAFRSWVDAADQLLRQRIVLAKGAS